jgi:DNA (cytosine-5)-methyltransferase 1
MHSGKRKKSSVTTSRIAQPGPRCIDLFAGAGGLAEGFRQAGWNIIAAVDNDPSAAKTFRMNFPRAKFFEKDIRDVSPSMLMDAAGVKCGELECLLGGPPCQSFSYNNHARTASSQRAHLFRQYLRIVKKILPKTIVMENVPGMLTVGDGAIVRAIRRGLEKLGYEVGIRILFAEDFGVPQERRRVFIRPSLEAS